MADVEIWEILEPLLYLGRRVKPNTAGAGKYRGGSGFESLRMVWKTNDLVMQNAGDGLVFPSQGLFGGYPAAAGYRHNVHEPDLIQRAHEGKPYPVRDYDPANSELEALVEGTRSFDGVMSDPKPGVSMLATRTGTPVLPVGISGTDELIAREQTLPNIGSRIILRVGRPFVLTIPKGADRREALEAADAELMRRIAALVEPRHRGKWEPWPDE